MIPAPPQRASSRNAVFSTAAVQLHRTAQRRDPHISPSLLAPRSVHAATFLLLCLLPTALRAQALPKDAPAVADAVAHAFETARAQAHLRRLSRIPDRPALRQIVCTAAASGLSQDAVLAKESQADSATFALNGLDHLPPELQRIAEYDDRGGSRSRRRIARYSVAAFTSPSQPELTWVGIALYWSRTTEYLALHLTRSFYPPDLRFSLVDTCRAIQ